MIKKIKDQARRDMKRFAGVPVKLSLFVRVEKDWRNKAPVSYTHLSSVTQVQKQLKGH